MAIGVDVCLGDIRVDVGIGVDVCDRVDVGINMDVGIRVDWGARVDVDLGVAVRVSVAEGGDVTAGGTARQQQPTNNVAKQSTATSLESIAQRPVDKSGIRVGTVKEGFPQAAACGNP